MRPILKGSEPAELTQWKALASEEWQPTYADLRGQVKTAIRTALLKEQGFICCYCEQSVSGVAGAHIEHLVAQSVDPNRALDFANMLCSCQGEWPPGPGHPHASDGVVHPPPKIEPIHCGHARGMEPLPVHPLMPDCREYFEFDSAGRIHPKEGSEDALAAKETIRLLRLDVPKLVRARQAAIEALIDELDGQAVGIETLVAEKDARDPDGRFLPFCSALVSFLRAYPRVSRPV